MEKRLFLAIALSLLILLSWSAFISKTQHIDNKAVTDKIVSAQSVTSPAVLPVSSVVIPEEKPLRPTEVLKFSSGSMELSFDEQRAAIIEVLFKDNRHYTFPLRSGFLTDDGSLRFKKINSTDNSISFSYQDQNKRIVKTFTFTKPSYTIELQINVENLSPAPINVPNMLLLGIANQAGQNQQARYQDVFLVNNDKSLHLSLGKSHRLDSVKTLGYRDQYFCAIVSPVEGTFTGYIKKNNNVSEIGLSANDVSLNAGTQIGHSYRIYLGLKN